jgi:toxin-antitoxin system PIN domain toxin
MTLFLPDLNVWLALSDDLHEHNREAWNWMNHLAGDARLAFSRYTQIGLLRLLVTTSVMGEEALTLGKAWEVYDGWLTDPRVGFYPEPRDVDASFRRATNPLAAQRAPKAVGDCWLVAFAMGINATLVTFDRALFELCRKQGHKAVIPA